MPLQFPTNPSVNDTYTFNGKTWVWNGDAWALQRSGAINGIVIGNVSPAAGSFTTLSATGNVSGGNITTAGQVIAVGNISGGNILGNGAGLSGINAFSTVAVTGGNSAVADSISDTLTITAGSGISLVMDASTDTLTITSTGSSESIFSTGGQMGLVTETVVDSEDLGLVTEVPAAEEYDLGGVFIDGFVGNPNFLPNSIYGNILVADAVITTTGNITAGNIIGNGAGLTNLNIANVASGTLSIANGGTNATTASEALSNLGGVTTGKAIAMAIVFGG